MIRNVDTSIGSNKKLIPKHRGPYVVRKVLVNDQYVITDIDNRQVTQLPYDGVVEAKRIRLWTQKSDSNDHSAEGMKVTLTLHPNINCQPTSFIVLQTLVWYYIHVLSY